MTSKSKRRRKPPERRYKKLFIISTEGSKTEPQYFQWFKNARDDLIIEILKVDNKSAPLYVLERMKKYLRKNGTFRKSDEAWLVVDSDNWGENDLQKLHAWSLQKNNHNFVVSNPKFEFWLLLHFEEKPRISSADDCSRKLKKHIPDYDKDIDMQKITSEMIKSAIERAKKIDNPSCEDWPREKGSTVYKLVEKILPEP